jgi:hypothetical protein
MWLLDHDEDKSYSSQTPELHLPVHEAVIFEGYHHDQVTKR